MLSDTRNDDASPLSFGLGSEQLAHNLTVGIIEVTDGFIDKNKVERLTQGTNQRYTLLLTE